jgi:hypothetical protein
MTFALKSVTKMVKNAASFESGILSYIYSPVIGQHLLINLGK